MQRVAGELQSRRRYDDSRTIGLVREAVLAGRQPIAAPRELIGASWRRMRAYGLDPGGAPEIAPLDNALLQRRRDDSGLSPLLPILRSHLLPAGEAAGQLMVVADTSGRVLWREGTNAILRHADRLDFVGGSAWTEANVGTNAIGTCIVTRTPVHIHGAEHFAETHTRWTCAAAPLMEPVTGRMLGVVDLSGPTRTVNAGTIALVSAAARIVELELLAVRNRQLNELRAFASPILAKLSGSSVVVTRDGITAAFSGIRAPERIDLPADIRPGVTWFPTLGQVVAEPLSGGWLLRLGPGADADERSMQIVFDLASAVPTLLVSGPSGEWSQSLSPRHSEILLALIWHREGRTAAELAADLFADHTRTVTVRAEVSRLRRSLGPILSRQPYRIGEGVDCRLVLPVDRTTILPGSSAPIVAEARAAMM